MKKTLLTVICLIFIISKTNSQNNGAAGAVVAGALVGAAASIAAAESYKELLEQKAVEYYLEKYPNSRIFEISTSSMSANKGSDMSNLNIVPYTLTDFTLGKKFVLFAFTSYGWINENGVDFSKVKWKKFNRSEWNNLVKKFLDGSTTGKKLNIDIEKIASGQLDDQGLKIKGKRIVKYPTNISGDTYIVTDYDEDMKIIFNEKSINFYLKKTNDLAKIKTNSLIKIHNFLN